LELLHIYTHKGTRYRLYSEERLIAERFLMMPHALPAW